MQKKGEKNPIIIIVLGKNHHECLHLGYVKKCGNFNLNNCFLFSLTPSSAMT